MNKEVINNLIVSLDRQTEITKNLYEISGDIKNAVEENDIHKVDRLVKIQTALVMKFSSNEKKIKNQFECIKNDIGHIEDDISISSLKNYMDKETGSMIEKASDKLLASFGKLTDSSQTNMLLLKSRLDWIDYSLNLLRNRDINKNKDIINDLI